MGARRAAVVPARPGGGPLRRGRRPGPAADQDRCAGTPSASPRRTSYLDRAASLRHAGPYQLQAAIAACHASSPSWEDTDWLQIVTLYDVLLAHADSPVTRLNRAVALAQLGPEQATRALADVDALTEALDGYHLFHATRAALLTLLGRADEAAAANRRALELTANAAERRLLVTRLHRHPLTDGT